MDDELLDLVNENDEVIGTIFRSEYDRLVEEKLGYIRAVEMYIQNSAGKFWVPTRTAHKKIAPNGLDYSMGGHVSSGESYLESALREVQEEIGLTLQANDLEFIHKFSPSKLPYFRSFYIYKSEGAPDFNREDFTGAEWLTPQAILKKLDNGTLAKDSLRETIEFIITNN